MKQFHSNWTFSKATIVTERDGAEAPPRFYKVAVLYSSCRSQFVAWYVLFFPFLFSNSKKTKSQLETTACKQHADNLTYKSQPVKKLTSQQLFHSLSSTSYHISLIKSLLLPYHHPCFTQEQPLYLLWASICTVSEEKDNNTFLIVTVTI